MPNAEDDNMWDIALAAIELVDKAAKTNKIGTVVCPKCGGDLHYKVNGPRHARAKCVTEGCLEFMS